MRKLSLLFSARLFPVLLLLLTVLGFGLLIPQLGFYWDDWAKILAGRLWGLSSYFAYYAGDRPTSAWTHILFTPLLGNTPLAWQIFALLLRWLSAWAMWWSLNRLWPRARWQNALASVLFLVYPVFAQQPAAVTFHQQWLQYALFLFSLGAMLAGLRPAPENNAPPGAKRAPGQHPVAVQPPLSGRKPVVKQPAATLQPDPRQVIASGPAATPGESAVFTRRYITARWYAGFRESPVTRGFYNTRALWAGLALLAVALQFSVTEYFIPVELLRVVVLWFFFGGLAAGFRPSLRRRLACTLRAWAPYALLLAGYAVYRLFIYIPPAGRDPYRAKTLFAFFERPLETLLQTGLVALVDEIRILVTAWADLFQIEVAGVPPFTLVSYALGLAAGVLLAVYLVKMEDGPSRPAPASILSPAATATPNPWTRQAFLLGLLGVLLGPVPAWITGRQVVFDFHSDRYAMPAMFGAALLLAAAINWLSQRRLQKAVLAGVLVALAVGFHLRTANDYRWIWTDQLRFYRQLSWRAPGLETPTLLLMENEPFPNQGLFSTSAALNLLYPQPATALQDPASADPRLGYWMYTLRPRFKDGLPDSRESTFNTKFRTLHFEGSFPDSLLLFRDPRFSNCLWLLSERDRAHPYLPALVRDFLPVSNLSRVLPESAAPPPTDLFGPEPEHGWCYYFETADLARQQADWPTAARLYDEAAAQGFYPGRSDSKSPYEWLPMIEALARTGRTGEAASLTLSAYEADPHYKEMLCALWEDGDVRGKMGCGTGKE